MVEVDYMANSDVQGMGINTSVENPGKLYAPFATKA
jgi:hypothetical protein